MASLGQELKQERDKRGISLEEISQATRISLRFLQAIENDNFEALPGGFFNKAFLRAYLNYLGLDEKALLSRHENFLRRPEILSGRKEAEREKAVKSIPWPKIVSLIFFLAVGLGFLFLLFQLRPKPEPTINRATIVEPVILPPEVVKKKEEKTAFPPHEINLKINFIEPTWIQVYVDGSLRLDGIKNPGATFEATAHHELLIHLGNAGGLNYTLNGFRGKRFGRSGAVVKNIRITLENFKDFLEEESPPDSSNRNSESNQP